MYLMREGSGVTWGEAILLKEVRNVISFFRDKVEGEKEKREFVFHTSLRCLLDIWMVMMKKQLAVCLEISKLSINFKVYWWRESMKIHDIDNNKKGENKEYKEKLLKSLPLRQTILLDSQSPLTQTMNAIIWTCLRQTIDIVIFQCISHTQIFKKELFSSIFL